MDREDEADGPSAEETPLLQENAESASPPQAANPAFPRKNIVLIAMVISILFILEGSNLLQEVPLNQILEEAICRSLFGRDANCNDNSTEHDIQNEFSLLRGWQTTLDLLPGILTAVPYGYVMDQYGRKLTLLLNCTGLILTSLFYLLVCVRSDIFPIRLTWLSPIFTLIGGGPVILNSVIFSMLADLSPDVYRTNVFFYLGAAILVGEFIFSFLAAVLMRTNLWAPIYLSLALFVPVIPICLALPETLPSAHEVPLLDAEADEEGNDDNDENGDDGDDGNGNNPSNSRTAAATVRDVLSKLAASTAFLFARGNQHLTLLLATLLTTTLGKQAPVVLLQFVHIRFGWTWAQIGYLVPLKALMLLLLLLLILPISGSILSGRWSYTPRRRDLLRARVSVALLIVGALVIALAPNGGTMVFGLLVYSLGGGYNLLLRSLLADLVVPAHRGTLFNAIGLVENLGAVVAGPMLAAAFRTGLRLQGLWTGLPFLVSAALFSTALVGVVSVRLPARPVE